jgi:hypothetical protein
MPRSKLRPEPQPKGVGCSLPQGPGRLLYLAEASFPLSLPVPGERWPRDGVPSIGSAPAGNRPGSLSQLMRAPAAHLPMHGTAGPFQKVVEPYHYSQPVVVVEVGWVIVVAIGAACVPLIVVDPGPATQHPGSERACPHTRGLCPEVPLRSAAQGRWYAACRRHPTPSSASRPGAVPPRPPSGPHGCTGLR